jgi:hypothetical protein
MNNFFKNTKNAFGEFSKWAGGLFRDETGSPSSKRFVGVLCAITLCITMYHNSFSTVDIAPAQYLVDAVALLAFSTLGNSINEPILGPNEEISLGNDLTTLTATLLAVGLVVKIPPVTKAPAPTAILVPTPRTGAAAKLAIAKAPSPTLTTALTGAPTSIFVEPKFKLDTASLSGMTQSLVAGRRIVFSCLVIIAVIN